MSAVHYSPQAFVLFDGQRLPCSKLCVEILTPSVQSDSMYGFARELPSLPEIKGEFTLSAMIQVGTEVVLEWADAAFQARAIILENRINIRNTQVEYRFVVVHGSALVVEGTQLPIMHEQPDPQEITIDALRALVACAGSDGTAVFNTEGGFRFTDNAQN